MNHLSNLDQATIALLIPAVLLLLGIISSVITGGVSIPIFLVVALVDAIVIAVRLERGEPVHNWRFF